MQNKYCKLLDFLFDLIEIQIKKYVVLTKIALGPDARLSAKIAQSGVAEMLGFAKELVTAIEIGNYQQAKFGKILQQINFHLTQEHLRQQVGLLINENNYHVAAFARVTEQTTHFKLLLTANNVTSSLPITLVQKQCHHDTNEIIFLLLSTIHKLKNDPTAELAADFPKRAADAMRKQAQPSGRYHDATVWLEIDKKLQNAKVALETESKQANPLKKSPVPSTQQKAQEQALQFEKRHRATYNELLERYRKLNSKSPIFSTTKKTYKIGSMASNGHTAFKEAAINIGTKTGDNKSLPSTEKLTLTN